MKYIIAFMLVVLASLTHAFTYTQTFTEAELQTKIEAAMPLVKKKYFMTITVSAPKLDLLGASNELSIKADLAVEAPGKIKGTGTTTISGSISYNPNKGSFHLLNPNVVELHVDGMAEQLQPKVKQVAQTAIKNAMSKVALYKLKDNDLKQKLAKSVLESVIIEEEKLLVNLKLL